MTYVVSLRPVAESDIDVFYEHQADPVAVAMAGTRARDRADHLEFWTTRILVNPLGIVRTVVVDGAVVGNILSWVDEEGRRQVGYRFGRQYWGRGIATQALGLYVDDLRDRPLFAFVVGHNIGSQRVLEKNGFVRISSELASDGIEEFLFVLN